MTSTGSTEMTLINCTQDDLYLQVGNTVVLMPNQAAPNAVSAYRDNSPLIVATKEGTTGLVLETGSGDAVTVNCPVRQENTYFVVTPEVLAQFPHRDDFVAVAAYKLADLPAGADDVEPKQVVVLTRLTNRLAVATPTSVNFVGSVSP